MKKILFILIAVLLLSACDVIDPKNVAPDIDTDNGLEWNASDKIKHSMVDTELYVLTIEIGRNVQSSQYQAEPAHGYMYASDGYASSSYVGPTITGKGLSIGVVLQSDHPDMIEVGTTVLMKFSDLKASILIEGDVVDVVCRRDFEALSPVLNKQDWQEEARTWELDVCRLVNPYIRKNE